MQSSQLIMPQVILSVILFLVLFFGIGFLLNMLLRSTWFPTIIYPVIVIFIIDDIKFYEYFTKPSSSLTVLQEAFLGLHAVDHTVLTSGLIGAVIAGVVIRMLRARGYQMF